MVSQTWDLLLKKFNSNAGPNTRRCLIPWFDGAILSQEWKEALWDKFVTGAPRTADRQWFA
jgi:hypothetical protein